jgi:hypothetical protein
MTMLTDGLKELGAPEHVAVKDIAEVVLEALGGRGPQKTANLSTM